MNKLHDTDLEIYETILNELNRIENGVELILSEKFVSRSVMQVIVHCIALVLLDYRDKALQVRVKEDIVELVGAFPLSPVSLSLSRV